MANGGSISAVDAVALARLFLDASHAVNSYKFANWDSLTPDERQRLDDAGWDLLNDSSSLTTKAVGIILDDLQNNLHAINGATALAISTVNTINDVKKAINVATSLVVLGGAIVSENPSAIIQASQGVVSAVVASGSGSGGGGGGGGQT